MKVNEPLTEAERDAADAELERIDANQKRSMREIADKLDSGEPLTSFEASFAAGVLRGVGNAKFSKPKRRAGAPTRIPEEVRFWFAMMTTINGVSKGKAVKDLAEKYSVSEEAIEKRLGMRGLGAERRLARAETYLVVRCVRAQARKQET